MEYEVEELDYKKLKYVLYARKSTTDESRQVRSIQDQISECRELAVRLGIRITKTIQETKSAKKPNQRPLFNEILQDLRKGKYDGILAWNPDRLARNMLEGGKIIDMIDEGIIKDLKFVTHHFTKDANGKMLLGMAFVLSKQYSDDLSQKVTRGVRRSFLEGKSPIPKHGYIRNDEGVYVPDGENFRLIQEAWAKRIEGESLTSIVEYLNENGYSRTTKGNNRVIKMTKQTLSKLFSDSFYYGVLIQADQKVDLREIYEFEPAISEEDYWKVQKLSYRKIKLPVGKRKAFYPLRMMVKCAYCDKFMWVGPSSGRQKKYLYYRCDNENCSRGKKSIRAKHIFNFIYEFLDGGLNLTEKEYNEYHSNLTKITDQKRIELNQSIHIKQGLLKGVVSEIKERSLKIIDYDQNSVVWKTNSQKIDELESQKQKLVVEIEKLNLKLRDKETDELIIEQFLNISQNASKLVQCADAVIKDEICRIIFLNLTVDEDKVTRFTLKEPFATLLKGRIVKNGRGYWIRTSNLTDPIRAR